MPIPNNIKMVDCVGRYAITDRDIMNGAGQAIAKNHKVKIVGFGRSLTIETEVCKHCGQYLRIRGVNKNSLTLINPDQTKMKKER